MGDPAQALQILIPNLSSHPQGYVLGLTPCLNETSCCQASLKHCDIHLVFRHIHSEFERRADLTHQTFYCARQIASATVRLLHFMALTIGTENLTD